jgi:hypothetical protein
LVIHLARAAWTCGSAAVSYHARQSLEQFRRLDSAGALPAAQKLVFLTLSFP